MDSSYWTKQTRIKFGCNILRIYAMFLALCIVYLAVPFVDYYNKEETLSENRNFFRLMVGLLNTLLLMSLIHNRVVLIVKSFNNHSLVEALIADFESRIKLI
jgi:hypothetical protein